MSLPLNKLVQPCFSEGIQLVKVDGCILLTGRGRDYPIVRTDPVRRSNEADDIAQIIIIPLGFTQPIEPNGEELGGLAADIGEDFANVANNTLHFLSIKASANFKTIPAVCFVGVLSPQSNVLVFHSGIGHALVRNVSFKFLFIILVDSGEQIGNVLVRPDIIAVIVNVSRKMVEKAEIIEVDHEREDVPPDGRVALFKERECDVKLKCGVHLTVCNAQAILDGEVILLQQLLQVVRVAQTVPAEADFPE